MNACEICGDQATHMVVDFAVHVAKPSSQLPPEREQRCKHLFCDRHVRESLDMNDPHQASIHDRPRRTYTYADILRVHGLSISQIDRIIRDGIMVPSVRYSSGRGDQNIWSNNDMLLLGVVKSMKSHGIANNMTSMVIRALRHQSDLSIIKCVFVVDGDIAVTVESRPEPKLLGHVAVIVNAGRIISRTMEGMKACDPVR